MGTVEPKRLLYTNLTRENFNDTIQRNIDKLSEIKSMFIGLGYAEQDFDHALLYEVDNYQPVRYVDLEQTESCPRCPGTAKVIAPDWHTANLLEDECTKYENLGLQYQPEQVLKQINTVPESKVFEEAVKKYQSQKSHESNRVINIENGNITIDQTMVDDHLEKQKVYLEGEEEINMYDELTELVRLTNKYNKILFVPNTGGTKLKPIKLNEHAEHYFHYTDGINSAIERTNVTNGSTLITFIKSNAKKIT